MLRNSLAKSLRLVSLWSGDALRRAKAIRRPRILMYHSIGHRDIAVEQFRWQLKFLRNEFGVVSLGTLIDRLASGSVQGDEVALTIDDGVRNQFTTAYPVLRDQGVPATIFVCPALTESGQWIWNTELRLRLRVLSAGERSRLNERFACTAKPAARGHHDPVEAMIRWAKQQSVAKRRELQAEVVARTRQFEPSEAQIDQFAPMTWEQVNGMEQDLITIGSHTGNHPILTSLSHELLDEEIAGSRRLLEQRIGRPVDLFSFPNGDFDAAVQDAVRRSYRAAVTTKEDFVTAGDDLYTLARISTAGTHGSFVRRLHRPTA